MKEVDDHEQRDHWSFLRRYQMPVNTKSSDNMIAQAKEITWLSYSKVQSKNV